MNIGSRSRTSLQTVQLHQHHALHHVTLQLANQLHSRLQRSSGRQQIIDHDHLLSGSDGSRLDFHHIRSVLQLVFQLDALAGQFALFANRRTTTAQIGGNHQAEQEAARLQTDDQIDVWAFRANVLDEQAPDCLANGPVGQGSENVPGNTNKNIFIKTIINFKKNLIFIYLPETNSWNGEIRIKSNVLLDQLQAIFIVRHYKFIFMF